MRKDLFMLHLELGQLGENLAVEYLESKAYKILDRNYKWMRHEIDIVCSKANELVVVEVKTRHTSSFGAPYQAVTRSKQRQIIKVANEYIVKNKIDMDVRFDVLSIVKNQWQTSIEHIENAFYPCL